MEKMILISLSLEELKEIITDVIHKEISEQLKDVKRQFQERLVHRSEVAETLGVTSQTLWNLEKRGTLIPVRIGRKIMYRESDITQYIDSRLKK